MHGRGRLRNVIGLGVFALLLTGCGGRNMTAPKSNDPLVGGQPAIPADPTARGKDPTQPLPVVPAPSASTSPANLAGGAVPALEPATLRIGENDQGKPPVPVRPATLSEPIPATTGSSMPPVPTATKTGMPAAPTGNSIDLLRVLETRGVQGFRLERNRESGEWRCTCSIPDSQNPAFKQTYEAKAADPASAMQSILDQIDGAR